MKLIPGHYYHAVPNTSFKSAGEEIPGSRTVRIKSTSGMDYCSIVEGYDSDGEFHAYFISAFDWVELTDEERVAFILEN